MIKVYDPNTKDMTWRSINVSNFGPGEDKRSSKSNNFTITHKFTPGAEFKESYSIHGSFSNNLQILVDIKRPAAIPGFKIGKGLKGGFSYFGCRLEPPASSSAGRSPSRLARPGSVITVPSVSMVLLGQECTHMYALQHASGKHQVLQQTSLT